MQTASRLSTKRTFRARATFAVAALIAAFSSLTASRVYAIPITSTTSPFTVTYDQAVAGEPNLTGSAMFSIVSFSSSQLEMLLTLSNTTDDPANSYGGARLTSIGWDTSPTLTGALSYSPVYSPFLGANLAGFQTLSLCGNGDTSCDGGTNGGLSAGQSASLVLVLDGVFGASPIVEFDSFASEFQTAIGSWEVGGNIACTNGCASGSVPEPGSLSLLAIGLLGTLVYAGWRNRNTLSDTASNPQTAIH